MSGAKQTKGCSVPNTKALAELREQGIRRFATHADGYEVEFFPRLPARPDDREQFLAQRMPVAEGDKKCHCKHELNEHNGDGLCLQGCPPEECGLTEEAKAE